MRVLTADSGVSPSTAQRRLDGLQIQKKKEDSLSL